MRGLIRTGKRLLRDARERKKVEKQVARAKTVKHSFNFESYIYMVGVFCFVFYYLFILC